MLAGLLLLLVANVTSWLAIRQISHREAVHAAERCADPRGDTALRAQWHRIAELIRRTNLKPTDPDYLPGKDAGKQFAASYTAALREAGPPPECLER
jgi:hypothetical protein